MGNCIYCGEPAGLFRKKHMECEGQHKKHQVLIQEGHAIISQLSLDALKSNQCLKELKNKITEIELSHSIPEQNRKPLLIKSWETAVDDYLEEGLLTQDAENKLLEFKNIFSLTHEDLDKKDAHTRTVKAAIIRDILNGIIPERLRVECDIPINFQKGEKVIWAFENSNYLEDKIRKEFVGGSQGISIRIAKGIYYKVGAFKGSSIEHSERVHIDNGWVVITDRNLYFAGTRKSLRIPYDKIVSFQPYSYGIGIIRDASSAMPQVFVTYDGWFTYNAITNLAKL